MSEDPRLGPLAWEALHAPAGSARASLLVELGDLIATSGRAEAARECYRAALLDHPQQTEALFGLSLLALDEGDHEGAILFGCHALESALKAGDEPPPQVCALLHQCGAAEKVRDILVRHGAPEGGET